MNFNKWLEDKNPILQKIIKDRLQKEDFIEEEYDPVLLPNIQEASNLIKKHIDTKSNIFIAGDFDSDGITSTTSIYIGLKSLLKIYNDTSIFYRVPTREEGHGLSKKNIDLAKQKKCSLIITVDNGSNDKEMITYASSLGIDVIVTDHHMVELKEEEINYIIVNPILGYKDKYICGVGVVYKMLQYLEELTWTSNIEDKQWDKIKMLTMIGTITDMVPLKRENLYFVLNFRYLFDKEVTQNTTLGDILRLLEYKPDDGKFFGWKIGPFFNSPGRLGDSNDLIKLLIYGDSIKEDKKHKRLQMINHFINLTKNRKERVKSILKRIEEDEDKFIIKKEGLLLIKPEDIDSGLKRLIIGSYNNKSLDVIFCGAEEKEGIISISATNNTNLDIISFLKKENLVIAGGGHIKAFGFSYKKEQENIIIDKLVNFFKENESVKNKRTEKVYNINISTIDNKKITDLLSFVKEINSFIWGSQLEEPLFKLGNKEVSLCGKTNYLGKEKKHISAIMKGRIEMKVIKWNEGDLNYIEKNDGELLYTFQINEWNGNQSIQLILK